MNISNLILCFKHCQNVSNVFCLKLPMVCPICGQLIMTSTLLVPLFRPQSPFIDSKEFPYSAILKPTNGTFLKNFTNLSNLHIGITDSKGNVFHFNEHGINKSSEAWEGCLPLNLCSIIFDDPEQFKQTFHKTIILNKDEEIVKNDLDPYYKVRDVPLKDKVLFNWDSILLKFSNDDHWLKERYDKEINNCYDFVLSFIKFLQSINPLNFIDDSVQNYSPNYVDYSDIIVADSSDSFSNRLNNLKSNGKVTLNEKTDFCKKYVLPKINHASKYIYIYRKILLEETFITNSTL